MFLREGSAQTFGQAVKLRPKIKQNKTKSKKQKNPYKKTKTKTKTTKKKNPSQNKQKKSSSFASADDSRLAARVDEITLASRSPLMTCQTHEGVSDCVRRLDKKQSDLPTSSMTHTQVYILSRLTVSQDHTRKQIYPNKNSPHPPPPTLRYQHLCDVAPPPAISNLQPPPPPPPPLPLPRQLPSDDNRLERLDPKGCPPLGRKSHPSYRTDVCYYT